MPSKSISVIHHTGNSFFVTSLLLILWWLVSLPFALFAGIFIGLFNYLNFQFGERKTYVDSPFNRIVRRVGLPRGSKVISLKEDKNRVVQQEVYVDNALNRALGRVGLPRKSLPLSNKSRARNDKAKSASFLQQHGAASSTTKRRDLDDDLPWSLIVAVVILVVIVIEFV